MPLMLKSKAISTVALYAKAISIVALYVKCLSGKFSELPQLLLIKFKTNSTFYKSKQRGFWCRFLEIPVIKEQAKWCCPADYPSISITL